MRKTGDVAAKVDMLNSENSSLKHSLLLLSSQYGLANTWDPFPPDELNQPFSRVLANATKSHDQTGEFRHRDTIKSHRGAVYVCQFSPDSTFIATGSLDKGVHIWKVDLEGDDDDASVVVELKILPGHDSRVVDLCWRDTESVLSSAQGPFSVLWDVELQALIRTFPSKPGYTAVAVSGRDPDMCCLGNAIGEISIFDQRSPETEPLLLKPNSAVSSMEICGDQGQPFLWSADGDGGLCVWDIRQPARTYSSYMMPSPISDFSLSTEERIISINCKNNVLTTFYLNMEDLNNVNHLELLSTSSHHKSRGLQTRTSLTKRDDQFLVAVGSLECSDNWDGSGSGGYAYVVDAKSGELVSRLGEHDGRVYGVHFAPTSPLVLATASADFTIRIWKDDLLERKSED